jgi:methyl-accepting chemotaxis protein
MLQALRNWDSAGSLDASARDEVGLMAEVINENVGRMRTTMDAMARITAMIEDSPSAVLFVDLAGVVSYVNRASRSAFAQLGSALPIASEAVVGCRFAELLPLESAVDARLAALGADPLRIDAVYGAETVGYGAVRVSDTSGRRLGTMVSWRIVTREAAERKKTLDAETDRRLMNRILETCGAASDADEVLDGTARALTEVLGMQAGAWWRAEAGGAFRRGGEIGRPLGGADVESTQAGLVGAAAPGRSLVLREDLAAAPGSARTEAARAAGFKSGGAFAIEGADGPIGAIEFYAAQALGFATERKDALRNVAKVVAAACDRLTQQAAARALAERDRAVAADQRRRADALLTVVDAAAQGDLTRDVPAEGDDAIGRMGAGLKRLIGDLRGHIGLIAQNAKQLGESAEELSRNSSAMARCAEDTTAQAAAVADASHRVSGNVETVASSTEEMSASIKDIARNAAEAAKTAKAAVDLATGTNEVVVKLGDSSQEIGAVVKVINSIAEQTNLLALNATIEAARAGDAGKGFAVVANEVKELAKETGKATEDIARRIEAIQTDTRGAVEAIGRISEVVSRISEIQTSIASAVEEQSAVTGEMGRGAGEAVRVLGESAKSVEAMTEASSDTARGAGEAQAASRELARIAGELHRLVGKFRLEAETKSATRSRPAHPSEWMRAGSTAESAEKKRGNVNPVPGAAS